tara:strand:- start:1394 stop:4066 length:2673 start_codon:yes stop_codon:yes gene_type:complete
MKLSFPELDEVTAYERINELHNISMVGINASMEDNENHEPWFNTTTNDGLNREIEWHYWRYYVDYLRQKNNPIPEKVLVELDNVTSKVLSKLEDPVREGAWDRRGLVMGSVQSGKTGNYTGLVAKAIDCGYKFIVILTGTHNSLRSQTQVRVNEELLGYNLEKMQDISAGASYRVGVGKKFNLHRGHREIQTLTTASEKGDFKKKQASSVNPILSNTNVLIIKKNTSILKNLNEWISVYASADGGKVLDIPLLIIDDECDQASVNTKKTKTNTETDEVMNDPTKTNEKIRSLLNLFNKSAYVGYTATPYANIFIHSEKKHKTLGRDLFPRNFIFSLTRPSNYIGPEEFFGLTEEDNMENPPLPLSTTVRDSELIFPPRHKKDLIVNQLPYSLKYAVKQYLISCAARLLRQTSNVHNSMLVHVTRYTAVQDSVSELIKKELQVLKNRIGDSNDELEDLQQMWNDDFIPTTNKMISMERANSSDLHTWEEINKALAKMILKIQVKQINGSAKDSLQYKEAEDASEGKNLPWEKRGIHIIAVGGDKLSRGLTLEGLTISYYLRASTMYDTLMQMGRWFGYRPGYLDLCRINTTSDLMENFAQIASAEKDLIEQFREMARSGATPEEFGLAVREDPGMLVVTNAGKRRDTRMIDLSFAGKCKETIVLRTDSSKHNMDVLEKLIKAAVNTGERNEQEAQNIHWKKVRKEIVVEFLRGYKGHFSGVNSKEVADFISLQSEHELEEWDLVIVSKSPEKSQPPREITCEGISFNAVQRKCTFKDENKIVLQRIVSRSDEMLDFPKENQEEMKHKFAEENEGRKSITGAFIRRFRPLNRGLLLIYGVSDTKNDSEYPFGGVNDEPYYGFAASFPSNQKQQRMSTIRKRANPVWQGFEFE